MAEASIIYSNDTETILFDYTASSTSPLVQFIGYAVPGAPTSSALWRIKKMEYDAGGNVTSIKWAFDLTVSADQGGPFRKVLVWEDRASYTFQ